MTTEALAPLNLKNCLTITFNDKAVELTAPPRSQFKKLRAAFVELQSYWIEYGFSTADLLADDHAWALMGTIASVLPRKDNPAVTGFDLELLQTDLEQIEQLFLVQDRSEIYAYRSAGTLLVNFYIDVFKGCRILEHCRFEPRLIVQEAYDLFRKRIEPPTVEPEPIEAEPEPKRGRKVAEKVAA